MKGEPNNEYKSTTDYKYRKKKKTNHLLQTMRTSTQEPLQISEGCDRTSLHYNLQLDFLSQNQSFMCQNIDKQQNRSLGFYNSFQDDAPIFH